MSTATGSSASPTCTTDAGRCCKNDGGCQRVNQVRYRMTAAHEDEQMIASGADLYSLCLHCMISLNAQLMADARIIVCMVRVVMKLSIPQFNLRDFVTAVSTTNRTKHNLTIVLAWIFANFHGRPDLIYTTW